MIFINQLNLAPTPQIFNRVSSAGSFPAPQNAFAIADGFEATIIWDSPNPLAATSIAIQRAVNGGIWFDGFTEISIAETSVGQGDFFPTLEPSMSYQYRLRYIYPSGVSAWTTTNAINTLSPPEVSISGNEANNEISLVIEPGSGVEYWELYWSVDDTVFAFVGGLYDPLVSINVCTEVNGNGYYKAKAYGDGINSLGMSGFTNTLQTTEC